MLHATAAQRFDLIILAELIALRTIVVSLQFALGSSDRPTLEAVQQLIERVDRDKLGKGQERLASAAAWRAR